MPFSAGTFSVYTPGNPVVTATTISSTVFNSTMTDFATGLSACLLKDGSQTVTANIPMAGFKFTGVGAGSAATDSATIGGTETLSNKTIASPVFSGSVTGTYTLAGTPTLSGTVAGTPTFSGAITFSSSITGTTVALGTNAASTGTIRLARAQNQLVSRNDANSANITLVGVDTTDAIEYFIGSGAPGARWYTQALGAQLLQLTSTNFTSSVDVQVPTKTPASAAATGVAGTIAWDASYIYVCVATNTWERAAIATW